MTDLPVRTIVRELINIVKSQKTGVYHLPEFVDGNTIDYDFNGLPLFSVEFTYELGYHIKSPYVLNGLLTDFNTINIDLVVNPTYYPNLIYDLIADLNDIVRHEIEHILQDDGDVIPPTVQLTKEDYYKQQKEIIPQIKGLKRICKLRNQPMERVVSEWFIRNVENHGLNENEIKESVKFLLSKIKEYDNKTVKRKY